MRINFFLFQKLVVRPIMSEKEDLEQKPEEVPADKEGGDVVKAIDAVTLSEVNEEEQSTKEEETEENRVSDQEISGSLIPATGSVIVVVVDCWVYITTY